MFRVTVLDNKEESVFTGNGKVNEEAHKPFQVCFLYSDDKVFEKITNFLDALSVEKIVNSRIGVVFNSVSRSQDFFRKMDKYYSKNEITLILLHSRYTVADRLAKESEIFEHVGKNSSINKPVVVIGTQTIEQSLDIDFDFMVSDIAPVENIIQRCGRIHRHNRGLRSSERIMYINMSSEAQKTASKIYTKYVIDIAEEIFTKINEFDLSSINEIVDMAYIVPETKKEAYLTWIQERNHSSRKASFNRIALPLQEAISKPLYGWLKAGEVDEISDLSATVRDGVSGPEVILIVQKDETFYYLESNNCLMPIYTGQDFISYKFQKKVLGSSVVLPMWFNNKLDDIISDAEEKSSILLQEWQQSALLKGEVPLILKELHSEAGEIYFYNERLAVYYDFNTGLTEKSFNAKL